MTGADPAPARDVMREPGLERRLLAAGGASLELVPGLGAKVVSLRRDGGAEWMAPPARRLRPVPPPPGAWGDYDCSGWDECFPNVAADPALGLADHGEVWSARWHAERSADVLRTTYRGPDGRTLERSLGLRAQGATTTLTADYRVRSGSAGLPRWAWAQHALLAADADTRIELPREARVRVEAAFRDGRRVDDAGWLAPDRTLPATTLLSGAAGHAAKLWFEPPLPEWVRVRRGAEWITWRMDRSSVPHLGLWVDFGGWDPVVTPDLARVAVEPAFGAHDAPAAAYAVQAGPPLEPHTEHVWTVVVELGNQ